MKSWPLEKGFPEKNQENTLVRTLEQILKITELKLCVAGIVCNDLLSPAYWMEIE